MKTHTNNFKNEIKKFGRQIDSKITYELNGNTIELGNNKLNSITPHYEGAILKSVMKQLDIDSNEDIAIGTEINYQFGVLIGNSYEYLDFGNYIVYSSEKQEDTKSYKIVCYDKLLYSMKDYENMGIAYPITIRNYINTICTYLGLNFANINDNFANYDKQIPNELYLSADGTTLGYTYRDILDELAQVTASTICINDNDELEIRYITNTNDTINEEYLKDINVNFKEQYGAINTIVLSRAGGSDNVYYPSTLPQNPIEIKIEDNQIMNGDNRSDYLQDIYNKLNGLQYYINDFSSTGICYYDLCDRYNITIGENTYSCVMLNDEINITQGLEENIHTDMPEQSVTDYTKADKTDRKVNQAYIMVDKQNQVIEQLVSKTQIISNEKTGIGSIILENAYEGTLHRLEITGNINNLYPSESLYPSNNLVPLDTYIIVDSETIYYLDINYLNYTSVDEHDTYIYEDGKQWIERANGTIEESDKEIAIEIKNNSTIVFQNETSARLTALYLLQNDYTDTFAPTIDLVSKINLSPGQATIKSNKIALEGYTTINNGFSVDLDGNMYAVNGTFQGNIYLADGNKVVGGDGLFSCLSYTSTGRYSNWDVLGFGVSGVDLSNTATRYQDVFVNAYIPENFVITSAYAILQVTSVNTAYSDINGSHDTIGKPKDLALMVGVDNTSIQFFYYPYQAVDEGIEYSGNEISNAFTNGKYTPNISSPGDVIVVKSIDIKEYLTIGEMNTIFVRSLLSPKPEVHTFTPSGASYTAYNYKDIVENTGVGRLNLFVFGYMNMEEI